MGATVYGQENILHFKNNADIMILFANTLMLSHSVTNIRNCNTSSVIGNTLQ